MDSNLHPSDLNPKWERNETQGHRFESLNYGFESLMKNKWRDWSWIRITYTTIQILGFGVRKNKSKRFESLDFELWRTSQSDSNLRVTDSNPISKNEAEGQTKSPTQRFESLIGAKFKFYKGDSNPLHSDLNRPFCRSIKYRTYHSNNPIFKYNLSHNN